MKLRHLLNELSAAEEAKRQGLKSRGYGYWEKDGKVVAKTVGDKLVPVKPGEEEGDAQNGGEQPGVNAPVAQDTEPVKPTGTSAKNAGTKPSNTPGPEDFAQRAGEGEKKGDQGAEGEQPQGPAPVPQNPFRAKAVHLTRGRPLERGELEKYLPDAKVAAKEYIVGETVILLDEGGLTEFVMDVTKEDFKRGHEDPAKIEQDRAIKMKATEAAIRQNQEFWQKLDDETFNEMVETKLWWQEKAQFRRSPAEKAPRHALINGVCNGPPPAKFQTERPIERGLELKAEDAEAFLSQFHIGDDMELPPSGFTTSPTLGRQYAYPNNKPIGVLMRLSPNKKGELYGLNLNKVTPRAKDDLAWKMAKSGNDFDDENEVIRYTGPKCRCVNVTKMVENRPTGPAVMYIIDLEEQGYPDAPIQEHEMMPPRQEDLPLEKKWHPVFYALMGTSLNTREEDINLAEIVYLLLNEGKAADQAHKLGLQHHGGPYWSKDGKIVAKTVKDTLVKVQPAEAEKAQTGFSAEFWKSNDYANASYDDFERKDSDTPYGEEAPAPSSGLKADAATILGKQLSTNQQSGGTNEGGVFEGKDGKKRYVKFYNDGNMAECEALADDMYRELGIAAPKGEYFDHKGKAAFASEMVPNVEAEVAKYTDGEKQIPEELARQILKGFVADCLMANWDVLGVNEGFMRNMVVTTDGQVVRIDNGSSFLHRGLNGRKKALIGDKLFGLDELEFFPQKNTSYKLVFQSAGISSYQDLGQDFVRQVADVVKLHNKVGGWQKYVESKAPDMKPEDKADVIKMLYERTKILVEKAKAMKGQG
jgi:hypothetical protein